MTRAGAITLFLFILNAALVMWAALGIDVGTVTPYVDTVAAQALTATSVWNTGTISVMGLDIGYFVAAAYLLITAVLFLIAVVLQMTVGAPAFYGSLLTVFMGAGLATAAFTVFLGLVHYYIILMFMYEQYKGGDTNS